MYCMQSRGFFFVSLIYLVVQLMTKADAVSTYDVVVIGGTPAGVAASIAAGRAGKSVILIEQSPVLGSSFFRGDSIG